MLNRLVFIFTFVLSAPWLLAQDEKQSNPYLDALPQWQKVLTTYVDEQGRTDFKSLAKNPDDLNAFVKAIGQVSPDANKDLFTTREQILAYHMNAYNALAMHGVIERDIPDNFSSFFKRASFFRFRGVLIGDDKTNLYDYENKVIRPIDEPRTHFALNCMVKDCPRLPKTAFTQENIESMLEALTVEFLNSEKHVRIDDDKKIAWVSGIMDFYTKDFVSSGKANDLIGYINQYRKQPIPEDYRVKYMDYDWTVNQQP